jgi:histidine triad (HIT) family protein
MSDCLFCRIVAGEIPATIVFQNDDVIAFDDISPQAPIHTLIIPRRHFANLSDGIDAATVGAVFSAVPVVADLKGVSEDGYRIIVNNGRNANQSVGHLHVHVLGGAEMSHHMLTFVED